MFDPPFDAAVQERVAWVFPAVADKPVGAAGAVAVTVMLKVFVFEAYNHIVEYRGQFLVAVYEFIVIDTKIDNKIKIVKNGRL